MNNGNAILTALVSLREATEASFQRIESATARLESNITQRFDRFEVNVLQRFDDIKARLIAVESR